MRIATWNVNSLKARLPRVEAWLAQIQPDVVCLQETKLTDAAFPAMTFHGLGYDSVHHGEGRWNGVAILSRVGLTDTVAGFHHQPGGSDDARLVSATCGGIRVSSVYAPNGRSLDSDQYPMKLAWFASLREHLDRSSAATDDVVMCGDFNVAPDDRDVYDPAMYVGTTHTSQPERDAFAALEAWGLVDVFRLHRPEDRLFSWWDYRAGNFHKHKGMRIDFVMASKSMADRSSWVLIDRNARKGQGPSDHAPLIAEFSSRPEVS